MEGAASIALLEKIHREMATKEGQEKLQAGPADLPTLSADRDSSTPATTVSSQTDTPKSDQEVTKKLGEIISLLHDGGADRDNISRKLDEVVGLLRLHQARP